MDSYAVIYLIANFFAILVFVKMTGVFYDKRRTPLKIMLLSVLLAYVMLSVTHLIIRNNPAPYLTAVQLFVSLFGYFVITMNYDSSLKKRLVVAVLTFTIFLFLAIIIAIPFYIMFPDITPDYDIYTNILSMVNIVFGYFLAALLRRFKNIRKNSIFPRIVLFVPIPIILVALGIFAIQIASSFNVDILIEVSAIILIILIAGPIFLIFYLYDTLSAAYEEKLKSKLQAQEKEYYFSQCRLMQESIEKVKSIQHDMKLHLTTLKDYSIGNTAALDYLNSLMENIEVNEIHCDSGNIAIDSIVNFKLRNAKTDNIKLDLSIAVPPEINVDVVDIVTIIGNLLDNALDAVAQVDKKVIKMNVVFEKGGLFIKTENSFNGEVKYSKEQQILTSKGGDGHGYGLKNIKQSVEKYDGYIKLAHDSSIFSAVVFLYMGDK